MKSKESKPYKKLSRRLVNKTSKIKNKKKKKTMTSHHINNLTQHLGFDEFCDAKIKYIHSSNN